MEIPPIFPSQINKSNPYYYLPDNYTIMTEQWWHNKFGDTLPDGYAEYLASHSRVEYDDIDREEATHKLKLNQEGGMELDCPPEYKTYCMAPTEFMGLCINNSNCNDEYDEKKTFIPSIIWDNNKET